MSETNTGHRVQIALAVISLVGVLGGAVIANWGTIFPPPTTTSTSITTTTPPTADPTSVLPPSSTGTTVGVDSTSQPGATTSGCVIAVDHFAAEIRQEPDHSSRVLVAVPNGDYRALDWTEAEWAGRTELWFLIEVESRQGWIVDSTILISEKSAGCP